MICFAGLGVAMANAAKENFIDDVDLENVALFRDGLAQYMSEYHPQLRY